MNFMFLENLTNFNSWIVKRYFNNNSHRIPIKMKVDVFKEIQSPFIIKRIIKTEYTGEKQQC